MSIVHFWLPLKCILNDEKLIWCGCGGGSDGGRLIE